jgi:hypothetical protein
MATSIGLRIALRRSCAILAGLLLLALAAPARDKSPNTPAADLIDEGTFAVFQNGQRVATEDFTVRQLAANSLTSAHLRLDSGNAGVLEQTSDLTLLSDGSLSRYQWTQVSPDRRSATVEPNDQVLIMHTVSGGKTTDHSFFLAPTTFILDDYVFSSREVLLWRYLATSCRQRSTGDGCDLIRARFPILVPRRNTSGEVFVEFKGYDDTPLNGRPQHLRHFVIQTDGPAWHLWLDEKHKLLRISIPDSNIEVLRQEK